MARKSKEVLVRIHPVDPENGFVKENMLYMTGPYAGQKFTAGHWYRVDRTYAKNVLAKERQFESNPNSRDVFQILWDKESEIAFRERNKPKRATLDNPIQATKSLKPQMPKRATSAEEPVVIDPASEEDLEELDRLAEGIDDTAMEPIDLDEEPKAKKPKKKTKKVSKKKGK